MIDVVWFMMDVNYIWPHLISTCCIQLDYIGSLVFFESCRGTCNFSAMNMYGVFVCLHVLYFYISQIDTTRTTIRGHLCYFQPMHSDLGPSRALLDDVNTKSTAAWMEVCMSFVPHVFSLFKFQQLLVLVKFQQPLGHSQVPKPQCRIFTCSNNFLGNNDFLEVINFQKLFGSS